MDIAGNITTITNELPTGVRLVAVSKTKSKQMIMEAYNAGQRIFGENKVQELVAKYPDLPGDIQWHHIGHLQTNKVKMLAPFVSLIEAVDSLRLLKEINKEAKKAKRIISCLLQFHIAGEDTKFGLDINKAKEILESPDFGKMENIKIAGVMGMATFTDDLAQVRREFRTLKNIFGELKTTHFAEESVFKEISMGMSGDYKIAIEEGSTLVRIGSLIFGERN